jgi:hypothetical protein
MKFRTRPRDWEEIRGDSGNRHSPYQEPKRKAGNGEREREEKNDPLRGNRREGRLKRKSDLL